MYFAESMYKIALCIRLNDLGSNYFAVSATLGFSCNLFAGRAPFYKNYKQVDNSVRVKKHFTGRDFERESGITQ